MRAQVQLHETTNHIEIHTTEITTGGVNQGLTVGVENADGTMATAEPGFNRTTANGTIKTNDYVAFHPDILTYQDVILTVTDSIGQQDTCTAQVTILDTVGPVLTCQDITLNMDVDSTVQITIDSVLQSSADNCTHISFLEIDNTTFTGCADSLINTVNVTGYDINGNASACTATVTLDINDNSPPNAQCQNVTIALDSTGQASITTNDIDNGSSDNCGIVSYTLSQTSFDCSDGPSVQVTLNVQDLSGNASSCTRTVTLSLIHI